MRLLLLLPLFSCLSCVAQIGVEQPIFGQLLSAGSSTAIQTNDSIAFYWHQADLTDSADVLSWTDRLHGSNLVSVAGSGPGKGSNYVYFSNAKFLTNWLWHVPAPFTAFVICRVTNTANVGRCFGYSLPPSSFMGLYVDDTAQGYVPDNNTVVTPNILNQRFDLVVGVAADGTTTIYTNGLLAKTSGAGAQNAYWGNETDHSIVTTIGGPNGNGWKGWLYECGLMTNLPTTAIVSNVHYQATTYPP